MPDLRKAPWNVVLAYKHLESFTSPAAAGNSQSPTGPNRVLSLARFLAQLLQGHAPPILRDVPPPDRSHLLSVAEYLADENLAGVFSDVDLHLDVDRPLPCKILDIFARYAAGIPTLRSYLQVGELTGGSALTCVGYDDWETPAMADIVAPRHCEGIKPRSPAATSDVNKAPWGVILAYTHLEHAATAAAGGNSLPSHPHRGALSLAGLLAELPKDAPILLHVPPPDRPHLLSVAGYLADYQLAGVFSDVDHLDDLFIPHKILDRFAGYAAGVPALRSYIKGDPELSGDSALTCAEDDGRGLPVDVAINPRRHSKGKHVVMVMEDDGPPSLSIGPTKSDSVVYIHMLCPSSTFLSLGT